MATLIDASVLVAAERGALDLDARLVENGAESFALAAITASELLHGVHRATRLRRGPRQAFVEGLLARLPVVPFDLATARVHAGLWADLAARGVIVVPHDLLVAATAVAVGARVATRDYRSFPRVPGLAVVRW